MSVCEADISGSVLPIVKPLVTPLINQELKGSAATASINNFALNIYSYSYDYHTVMFIKPWSYAVDGSSASITITSQPAGIIPAELRPSQDVTVCGSFFNAVTAGLYFDGNVTLTAAGDIVYRLFTPYGTASVIGFDHGDTWSQNGVISITYERNGT